MLSLVEANVVLNLKAARELRIEIETVEAQLGPNPYTAYLRKHGERPPRDEAVVIGKTLGRRVKACDGSMQPPLSKSEKAALQEIKSRRNAHARRFDHVTRLKAAIATFVEMKDDLSEVIADSRFLPNSSEEMEKIDIGLYWMTRFAELWHDQINSKNSEIRYRNHQQTGA